MGIRCCGITPRLTSALAFALLTVAETDATPTPPVLSPPQVSGSTVALAWTVPLGTTGIRLEAGTAPGLTNAANAVFGPVGGYTATSVPNGVYYVRIRAIDLTGESAPSNEITVVVGGGAGCFRAPDPPIALQASFGSPATMVTFSWTPAITGCPASSFILQAGSATELSDLAVLDVGPSVSFTAVVPVAFYYVRVLAQNAYGTSLPSNEFVPSSVPIGPPGAGGLCPAPVLGTVTGCWQGYTYYGDGLVAPPGFCAGARYHVRFVLRQSAGGAVSGSYETTLIVPSPDCPLPSHRIGQRLAIPITGTVVGDTFAAEFPFAPGAPVSSPFAATFTATRINGYFRLDGVPGVTAPGTFAVNRQ